MSLQVCSVFIYSKDLTSNSDIDVFMKGFCTEFATGLMLKRQRYLVFEYSLEQKLKKCLLYFRCTTKWTQLNTTMFFTLMPSLCVPLEDYMKHKYCEYVDKTKYRGAVFISLRAICSENV